MSNTSKARALRADVAWSTVRLIDEVGLEVAMGYLISLFGQEIEACAEGREDPVLQGVIREMDCMLAASEVVRKL